MKAIELLKAPLSAAPRQTRVRPARPARAGEGVMQSTLSFLLVTLPGAVARHAESQAMQAEEQRKQYAERIRRQKNSKHDEILAYLQECGRKGAPAYAIGAAIGEKNIKKLAHKLTKMEAAEFIGRKEVRAGVPCVWFLPEFLPKGF